MVELGEGEVSIILFYAQDEPGLHALETLEASGAPFRAFRMENIKFITDADKMASPTVYTIVGDFFGPERFHYFTRTYIDPETRRHHKFFQYT